MDQSKDISDSEAEQFLRERFKELPAVVQRAITSADISKRLRELASTHQLHVDQWEALENEVQLTLLGLQPPTELPQNLADTLFIPLETAIPLAGDITRVVFEPIREELERELEHPDAEAAEVSAIDEARTQVLADNQEPTAEGATITQAVMTPAPPPAPIPSLTATTPSSQAIATAPVPAAAPLPVTRAPVSPTYEPGTASHERKVVSGDPYREQV
jgi:hypothetical protein